MAAAGRRPNAAFSANTRLRARRRSQGTTRSPSTSATRRAAPRQWTWTFEDDGSTSPAQDPASHTFTTAGGIRSRWWPEPVRFDPVDGGRRSSTPRPSTSTSTGPASEPGRDRHVHRRTRPGGTAYRLDFGAGEGAARSSQPDATPTTRPGTVHRVAEGHHPYPTGDVTTTKVAYINVAVGQVLRCRPSTASHFNSATGVWHWRRRNFTGSWSPPAPARQTATSPSHAQVTDGGTRIAMQQRRPVNRP